MIFQGHNFEMFNPEQNALKKGLTYLQRREIAEIGCQQCRL